MTTTDKLQHGDYVEGLTKEQAGELLNMDGRPIHNRNYIGYCVETGIMYSCGTNQLFAVMGDRSDLTTLHDFPTFKQKCINTFQL